MQVQIFIDCSASMGKDNPKKAAYVVATAAALGFLAVQNMDKASFYLMKGDNAENENGTIVGKKRVFPCGENVGKHRFRRRNGH